MNYHIVKRAVKAKITKAETDPLGFSSVNSKFKANDIIAEIQVNTPDIIYAKEPADSAKNILGSKLFKDMDKKYKGIGGKGHLMYEKWRVLNAESSRAIAIAKKSREYYSLFR